MKNHDRYLLPLFVLILVDVLIFGGSVLLAYSVRFSAWFSSHVWATPAGSPPPLDGEYLRLALYALAIGLAILERFGFYSYREGLDRGIRPVSLLLAIIVSYVFLMAWLFLYVHASYSYSRLTIILAMVFTFVLGLLSQHLLRALMGWLVSSGIGFTRTLVVAGVENCQSILERMRFAHGSIHQVAGLICAGDDLPGEISGVPVLGRVKDFSRLIDRLKDIDRVVVALPVEQHEKSWEILESCRRRRIDCRFVPELFDLLSLQVDVSAIDGLPSITLGETPLTGAGPVLKRLMDMTVASIGLVVASPVMILFALLIKLDSKGPALFKQQRLGSDGRVFDMYKFRTMHIGAEALTGPVWATNNDPRCTRVGRWLRRTNLDELPQILNVLRGEMSLVGPRPERAYFVNKFKTSVPQYMRRHLVKSGITGWAQVNGLRGNTPVEERVRYDIFYIENWSLLFDLKIMFRTLFSTKNAY